jgi:trimethylamine:corrinoid methyltransferase-like protein
MVMGSPEHQLYALAAADLTAFYSGSRKFGVSSAYTRANWPGYQAAAEKASAMTTGALLGSRFFMTPGTLALDEVFSPEQFLIDVEVRDHVQRLVDGFIYREDDYDWVEQIGAGAEGTFLAQDSTLDVYREAYWQPRLFDRGFLHGHEQGERARQLQRIRAMVRDSLASYDFELDADRRREMHRIWQAAVESYATTDEHR